MKNANAIPVEDEFPPTRRSARRMPPPSDDPLPPKRGVSAGDLEARLERLRLRSRFSHALDLAPLAATWANDYVSHVFPNFPEDESKRLLLACEAGFLASIGLGRNGIRYWERLLEQGRVTRDELH